MVTCILLLLKLNLKKKYASLLEGWGKELKDVVYIKSYLLPATYSMLFFLITSLLPSLLKSLLS